MKKVLDDTPKTCKYLSSLPKVYIIAYWASWGIRDYPFSGKFNYEDDIPFPLVWDYYDGNGTCSLYKLRDIRDVTTGSIIDWTFNKAVAELIANTMNEASKIEVFDK